MILEWEGKRYDLADAHLSIGRQFKNDIVIRGKLISRTHCEIENGKILDRSTNGTFVNNKPLLPDIQVLSHVCSTSCTTCKIENFLNLFFPC
mmetsp:Transcript_1795/g.2679  ORF Transcript_1795/g.2679 Transcript_1795/m.2679 type:complete len:92 (+) Transcript_1795:719-994(+)